jgi:cysteinyl-tRNA synthetase
MKLYNTLSRSEESFEPLSDKKVTLYSCGPTVYDETHIGHMRKFTMDDILKRALRYAGYDVNHVMNITDVGHLTGDDDSGEDKLEKGAKKQGKTVWDVARHYTDRFFMTMDALGIERADTVCKATDHIEHMIDLIKRLEEKGLTYETEEAIYFDVTKFPTYGKLSGQKIEDKMQAVRDEVHVDSQKKHPADFALWFKRIGRFADHTMHWPSPWGDGFPGWHIECSAMSMQYLGETIDIHTGGIDHIPVHHENEIAQSEGATGKEFVRFWVHHAFLQVNGEKMSKSKGNFYTIDDIHEQKLDPIALRYLFFQTHYRKPMNFTWEAAKGAEEALMNLRNTALRLKQNETTGSDDGSHFEKNFHEALNNDLQMSQALAVIFDMLKSDLSSQKKLSLLEKWDAVLGLQLLSYEKGPIPHDIEKLAQEREDARKKRDFQKSDELRKKINEKGYEIEDTNEGYTLIKN